jgi:hypothetical protein
MLKNFYKMADEAVDGRIWIVGQTIEEHSSQRNSIAAYFDLSNVFRVCFCADHAHAISRCEEPVSAVAAPSAGPAGQIVVHGVGRSR